MLGVTRACLLNKAERALTVPGISENPCQTDTMKLTWAEPLSLPESAPDIC